MTDLDLSTWLTKQQAADAIGVSTKQVERFTRAGKLEQRSRPQKGSPDVAVYFPDDVTKLAAQRQPAATPFVVPADPPVVDNGKRRSQPPDAALAHGLSLAAAGDDPLRALFAAALRAVLSQTSQTPSAPMSETLYLTIGDAAIYANLPAIDIRRACESGALKARKTGRGGWRIKRTDLDAW